MDYGELRDYQIDFSNSVANDFNNGHRKLIAVMATGGGKTVTFGHIAKRYLAKNPDKVVVVISHLGLLIPQTRKSFQKFWKIESQTLQAQEIPNTNGNCILTTMQSFKDIVKLMSWGGHRSIGLIIVDEAHRMFSKTYEDIFKMMPEDYLLLGVTATPFKENQLLTSQFEKLSYSISTLELISMGHLVRPELRYSPFTKDNIEINIKQIIELYKKNHIGHKAIVYLKTTNDCRDMKQILDNNGIRSSVVTGNIKGKVRDDILDSFKNNEVDSADILLTVDVLTAGFDSPNIRAIFMPYATKSVVAYLQRIGRGLRPDAGKTICAVYIGGKSPELMKKEWEKIQVKALNLGKRFAADVFEDIELNKDIMTKDEFVINKRIADIAMRVKKMEMHGLYDILSQKEVPSYLLDAIGFMSTKISANNSKVPASPAQERFLKSIGVDAKLSKTEAGLVLDAYSRSKGVKQDDRCIVPSGKFKGWDWKNVPHAYKKLLRPALCDATLIEHYTKWKQLFTKGIKR